MEKVEEVFAVCFGEYAAAAPVAGEAAATGEAAAAGGAAVAEGAEAAGVAAAAGGATAVPEADFLVKEEPVTSAAMPVAKSPPRQQTGPLIERLERLMTDTQMYRRQGVRIGDVAVEMGVNHYLISQAINSHFGQRFTDYINEKRIAYVKQRIVEGAGWKKFSIEGLAADSGFSSRTPFYAAFRKITGLTPSEYIDKVTSENGLNG